MTGGLPMNRRKFIRNLGIGAAGYALGTASGCGLQGRDDVITITVLHTNDLHAHIEPFEGDDPRFAGRGGLARIAAMAKEFRKQNPNTLLFDAGDMFQGTPYFNYFKGELMLKLMTAAGYDAGTIGNHEFDNGLSGLLEPLPNAGFPLISSNYDFSTTVLAGKIPRYKIFRRSGISVGVYGLGIELDGLVSKKSFGDTIFKNPLQVAREMEDFLKREQKCDLVVCLSHLGLDYRGERISDKIIAAGTSMTDLIIGGHTHTWLEEPLALENRDGKQVIVNQAWWGGLVMGKIDFIFEQTGRKIKAIFAKNMI